MSPPSQKSHRFDPRAEALAYRIWGFCAPRGWNCTYAEVAEALDLSAARVRGMATRKGWLGRFRKEAAQYGAVLAPGYAAGLLSDQRLPIDGLRDRARAEA